MQSYAFIHKNNVFSEIFVLKFAKSDNLKVLIAFFSYLCTINQNIEIMKKLEAYENRMGYMVGGSILPSTPGERELEHKCNPHPNDWIDDIYSFNKLPFAVRMPKGLVTQAEEERRKGRYGYLRDLISSFRGSDAPYFADMILEPIEEFNAKHFPDGREKKKAATMW